MAAAATNSSLDAVTVLADRFYVLHTKRHDHISASAYDDVDGHVRSSMEEGGYWMDVTIAVF